jgi:hypothetical protein
MGRYEIAKEVPLQTFLHKDVNDWNKPLEMHTQVLYQWVKLTFGML